MARVVPLETDVFETALGRIRALYEEGHRVIVATSGGKDSAVCLELTLMVARETGNLPVEAVTRDEEIIYPGVIEYLERVHEREEVELHWYVGWQPIINIFNRLDPYWWVFDRELDPSEWVREPPDYYEELPELNLDCMVTKDRFPPAPGKDLCNITGVRTAESRGRWLSILSAGGHMCQENRRGQRQVRPIYDWQDGDVWRAILLNNWDYASCYDVFNRYKLRGTMARVGPPTMNGAGVTTLRSASQAWPQWWDRVQNRVPGIRSAVQFGNRVLYPERRLGEEWETTFKRECIENAPDWIAERATAVMERQLSYHASHTTDSSPLPQANACVGCGGLLRSWREFALWMYGGDPFSTKCALPLVQPEFFRKGAGVWGGAPM